MSLDGFITGSNEGVGNPLGNDQDRLHDWMFARRTDGDAEILDEVYATTGAILIGRRMFDVGEEPWGDPPPFHMPVFVLTHEAREPIPKQGGTTYTFVTDGVEVAVEQARAAAGDMNVGAWGGANILQQCLKVGRLTRCRFTWCRCCWVGASACSRLSVHGGPSSRRPGRS